MGTATKDLYRRARFRNRIKRHRRRRRRRTGCLIFLPILLSLFCFATAWGQIPHNAYRYEKILRAEVMSYWGVSQDIDIFAAQIHQESAWRPDAQSPYASGIGQFTPDTADWIEEIEPSLKTLGGVFDPRWGIRGLVVYDYKLFKRFCGDAATEDDCWAFILSGYNGGPGWVIREKKLAQDPTRWFCDTGVAKNCIRADWACKENREYPRKILYRWAPLYRERGFK